MALLRCEIPKESRQALDYLGAPGKIMNVSFHFVAPETLLVSEKAARGVVKRILEPPYDRTITEAFPAGGKDSPRPDIVGEHLGKLPHFFAANPRPIETNYMTAVEITALVRELVGLGYSGHILFTLR